MVITIVGDLEFDPAIATIRKYFSQLPASTAPAFPTIEFEGGRGRKTAVLEAKHTPTMITGWHKPSIYWATKNPVVVTWRWQKSTAIQMLTRNDTSSR